MKLYILLFTLLFFLSAFAAEPGIGGGALKVFSKSMRYYGKESKTVFKGDVVVVGDNFTITSDEAVVFLGPDKELKQFVCIGSVNFKTEDTIAVSKRAEVDEKEKTLTLIGDARVWRGSDYVEGENIRLHYETKETYISKGDKEKVTVIINRQ